MIRMSAGAVLLISLSLAMPSIGLSNGISGWLSSGFPTTPHPSLTSGSLCARADQIRYPERIAYCERNVSQNTKAYVIRMYDQLLGFRVSQMDHRSFKIDHYIPLCAGGSNEINNLWPQHKSVYAITDPMEPLVCEKMAQGKLSQRDAVRLIQSGKNDLSQVPDIIRRLLVL